MKTYSPLFLRALSVAIAGLVLSAFFGGVAIKAIFSVYALSLVFFRWRSEDERRMMSAMTVNDIWSRFHKWCKENKDKGSSHPEREIWFCQLFAALRHHDECWPNDPAPEIKEVRKYYREFCNDW